MRGREQGGSTLADPRRVWDDAAVSASTRAWARTTLVVLTAINFLNYIDRYVLAAVIESVRVDFVLDDADAGLLGIMFIIVYTIASPFAGWFGDRGTRKWLVAGGVVLWSLATVGCGFARDYRELLMMRSLVGIGEAGYATVAPGMIADLFAADRRGRMLAWFYLAIPVGSALGYVLGGTIAGHHEAVLGMLGLAGTTAQGWRVAFAVAGVPGLLFALAAAMLPEPVRGRHDAAGEGTPITDPKVAVRRLFASPAWRATTGGMVLMTFALGGLAFWMPTFLQRAHGMDEASAGSVFGGLTVVGGLIATMAGGWLGDRAQAQASGGYLRVSGWGLILGAPAVLLMAMLDLRLAVLALAFVAEFFLFLNTGPLNAALVGCVPANLRASSMAINVFLIHALGDALSPWLMGVGSRELGPGLVGTLGDSAQEAGLRLAIAVLALPLVIGGLWLLRGATRLDGEPEGLLAVDRPTPTP
jgi:predicted MFS family arabinose efflux permease